MPNYKRGAALVAALLIFWGLKANAEPVTISTVTSGVTVQGEILSFDRSFLRLKTSSGIVTMKAEGLTCLGDSCPDFETFIPLLRVSGAGRIGNLLFPSLIEGFARSSGYQVDREEGETVVYRLANVDGPFLEIRINSGTTDEGFRDLISGKADVVMAAREIRDAELDALANSDFGGRGNTVSSRVIALDALIPVTGSDQSALTISMTELAGVFSGEITDWGPLGGQEGAPIHLYLPTDRSGFAQEFLKRLTGSKAPNVSLFREDNTDVLSELIAQDPHSLGILPTKALGRARSVGLVGECGLRSVPRVAAIKTEDYPLTFPLFLYLPNRPMAPVFNELFDWLRTAEAQLVVRRAGFVDQGPVPIGLEVQGERLANAILASGAETNLPELKNLVQDMYNAVRLSPTFRFEEGSSQLDVVSRTSLLNLAQGITDGRYSGKKLKFSGFSDGNGSADANKALSEARALSVVNELLEMLGGELPDDVVFQTGAYGEVLPIGCDESPWGRQINRRVELWLENGSVQGSQ